MLLDFAVLLFLFPLAIIVECIDSFRRSCVFAVFQKAGSVLLDPLEPHFRVLAEHFFFYSSLIVENVAIVLVPDAWWFHRFMDLFLTLLVALLLVGGLYVMWYMCVATKKRPAHVRQRRSRSA